jgi:nitroreductase
MNTREAIYTRRSVRAYKDTLVDKATIEKLFDAASKAPSARNSQPWAFGVIQDKAILKSIADRSKEFLRKEWGEENMPPYFQDPEFNIFYTASTLLLILCKPDGFHAISDCALAAQNLMLMAHDMGLGTCWIGLSQGFLNTPEAKRELGIPENFVVAAPIIVGWPDGETPEKDREPVEVVFWKA